AQQDLIAASKMNISELCYKYNSSVNGFQNDEQVVLNKSEYGANILSKKSKNSVLKRIVDAFFNPFSIILIILSLISIIVDIILPLSKFHHRLLLLLPL
ncbi:cation-transporting P-type ATPase, partial [Mycoplasmopsis bovis]|uniref:cation-transporting P-type ATPase n=1 Tax=Mycoplasmopsis bovis TaxID=28903 RepID=UPI003D270DD4